MTQSFEITSDHIAGLAALDHIAAQNPTHAERVTVIAADPESARFQWLIGFIGSVLSSRTDDRYREDATQIAASRILNNVSSFPGGNMRGWIVTIACNAAIDLHRKQSRQTPYDRDNAIFADQQAPDRPDDEAIETSALSRIQTVLEAAGVNEAQRDVVYLHALGYGKSESAQILGIKPGTAGSRLSRALASIREHYGIDVAAGDKRWDVFSEGQYDQSAEPAD